MVLFIECSDSLQKIKNLTPKMRKFNIRNLSTLLKRSRTSSQSCDTSATKAIVVFSVAAIIVKNTNDVSLCDSSPKLHSIPKAIEEIDIKENLTKVEEHSLTLIEKAAEIVRLASKLLEYMQRIFVYTILGVPVLCVGTTAYALGGVSPQVEDLVWVSSICICFYMFTSSITSMRICKHVCHYMYEYVLVFIYVTLYLWYLYA